MSFKSKLKVFLSYTPYWLTHLRYTLYVNHYKNRAFWPRQKQLKFQYTQLKSILNSKNSEPTEVIRSLSIQNKDTLRDNFEFNSINSGVIVSTSGSSGEPFRFRRRRRERLKEKYFVFRVLAIYGYKAGEKIGWLRSYIPDSINADVVKYDKYDRYWYFSAYDMSSLNMDRYLDIILKEELRFLFAYPSSMFLFAQYLCNKKITLDKVLAIYMSSEMLHTHWRRLIEDVFPNAEVLDVYNNVEASALLTSCSICKGYHLNFDYGYTEFETNKIENKTQLIGTGFLNSLYPMVRYDTGDQFQIHDIIKSKCRQGSDVVIGKIIGRSSDLIVLEDKSVPAVNIYTVFYKYSDYISMFQLVQLTLSSFKVLYVLNSNLNSSSNVYDFKLDLQSELLLRFGQNVSIEFEKVAKIPRDINTGKHKAIVGL